MSFSEQMLDALDNQDLEAADVAFANALENDPEDVLAALGENLYHLGFISQSRQVFEQLLEDDDENEDYLLYLGELAAEEEEYDKAFAYFDRIDETSDAYPEALLDQADIYQVLELPEVAELKLRRAQELLPEDDVVKFALAELLYSLNRFLEAASLYQDLLNDDEAEIGGVAIEERYGISLAMSGKFEEAVAPLRHVLEKEETEDRLFYLAYTYQQIGENERAILLYRKLLNANPEYTTVYVNLGKLLQEQELLDEAQDVLDQGITYAPFQTDLYLLAAENAYRLHDADKSQHLLEKALETGQQEEEVVLALSNLYATQEKFADVLALYQKHPSDLPQALWDQARAYNALENYDDAFKNYALAYASLKEEPSFMKEYGLFLREEGHLKEAKQLLRHYLQHMPEDTEVISVLDSLTDDGE